VNNARWVAHKVTTGPEVLIACVRVCTSNEKLVTALHKKSMFLVGEYIVAVDPGRGFSPGLSRHLKCLNNDFQIKSKT
jgi:hypothetical protein